jgi:Spy/CpxP family protein refolding chaperone
MRLLVLFKVGLITGIGLSACASRVVGASQPAVDDVAAIESRTHHRAGVTQFIALSLDTLAADHAKRSQIEKYQSDLHACMQSAGLVEKGLLLTLADGVAIGAIATAAIDAAIAQLNTAAAAAHECSADTLNQLHALLSPAERAVLADRVQAHWRLWRFVNHEAEPGGRERGGRLAEIASELRLTEEQIETISADLHVALAGLFADFDPLMPQAHVRAFAVAFVSETFDAGLFTENANAQLATHAGRLMALFYATVAPRLTPEQRLILAGHLRDHANHQLTVAAKYLSG